MSHDICSNISFSTRMVKANLYIEKFYGDLSNQNADEGPVHLPYIKFTWESDTSSIVPKPCSKASVKRKR